MQKRLLALLLVFLSIQVPAQTADQLNQLRIVGKPIQLDGEIVSRNIKDVNGELCGMILVLTDIEGLSFTSNNGMCKDNVVEPGRHKIYLSPNERVVNVFKSGFKPLKIILNDIGIKIESGKTWQIEIFGTKTGLTRSDENLLDVIFQLNQDQVYSWYGDLAPVLTQDRIITYKLPKGNYTFHFQKEGFKAEEKTITVDKNFSETISLVQGSSSLSAQLKLPGIMVITSEPNSAEIILNGQKIGTTTYQGELQPGSYEVELRKTFYHSDLSSFTIEQGKTLSISRNLKPKFGFISVSSNIPNSKVTLDGKLLGNVPIETYQLESSSHTVKVESDLYHSFIEEILLTDGEHKNIIASLKPAFGSVEINSLPEDGADIFIDGNKIGQTPFSKDRLASGKYLMRITKELFRDYEEQITISDGERLAKNISLDKNFGEVTVIADGCEIFLNGKTVSRNRTVQKLNSGRYTISAEKGSQYYKAEQELFLSIGDKKEITLTPQPRMGGVSVFIEPTEASDAEISINGEIKGQAPLVLPLIIGEYRITAKKDNYLEVSEQFSLSENEQKKITLNMMTYEGSHLQSANKWATVKWISFAGAAVLGGASYYFKMTADKNFDSYKSATTTADALNFRKLTDDNKKFSDYFLYATTAALSNALISWIIEAVQ